jgi:hypothetical protein
MLDQVPLLLHRETESTHPVVVRHHVRERRRATVVEVRRVLPQCPPWGCAVRLARRARRVRPVDAGFRRRVQRSTVVIGASHAHVAGQACLAKQCVSTLSGPYRYTCLQLISVHGFPHQSDILPTGLA